jgi:uncharacterized alpha-E superfamily protein
MLILDRRFPRSMHFGVIKAQESLREITGSSSGTFSNHCEQLMGRLRSGMDYADIGDVMGHGLHEFIDDFQKQLNAIGLAIHDDFFTPPKSRAATVAGDSDHPQPGASRRWVSPPSKQIRSN